MIFHLMPRRNGIGYSKLGDQGNSDANLVAGQHLLGFDRLARRPDVHHVDAFARPWPISIAARLDDSRKPPMNIEQAPLVFPDDPFRHWRSPSTYGNSTAWLVLVIGDPRGLEQFPQP